MAKTATAGLAKDSLVPVVYYEALRNRAVLAGGSFALLVLALRALSEIANLQLLHNTIVISAIATVLLAVLATALAIHEGHRAHSIAEAVGKVSTKLNTVKSPP